MTFVFSIFDSNNKIITETIKFGDWEQLSNTKYFECIEWIFNEENKLISYSNKLKMIRGIFKEAETLSYQLNCEKECTEIINSIIKDETSHYFKRNEALKKELIEYTKLELESNRSLIKSLLGLFVTLGTAIILKIITTKDMDFSYPNTSIAYIFMFGLVAVLFVIYTYFIDYLQRRKFHKTLQKYYKEKLNMPKTIFLGYVPKPRCFLGNITYWITIFIFVFFLVYLSNLYYETNIINLFKKFY